VKRIADTGTDTESVSFRVRQETADAFLALCARLGRDPDGEIERMLQHFIENPYQDALATHMEWGEPGVKGEEEFKVDIVCDDPMCSNPQIRIEGHFSPESKKKKSK
jgi:hypothetical protein